MNRLLALLPLLVWIAWPATSPLAVAPPWSAVALFLGGYVVLVAVIAVIARRYARGILTQRIRMGVHGFNRIRTLAATAHVLWYFIGLWLLDWHTFVFAGLGLRDIPFELPAMAIGVLPAILAWVGLWWAEYPAETALREQSLVFALEENLPVHAPPPLSSYIAARFRLQSMLLLIPFLILGLSDLCLLAMMPLTERVSPQTLQNVHGYVLMALSFMALLASPALLRRILRTRPLPDSPLRDRLIRLAQQHKLRCREILLWQTDHHIGNAAVMGLVPRFRYVMLSDLLIETMTDKQIEAVFAHELGHVVHRHMQWYVVIVVTLVLVLSAIGQLVEQHVALDALPLGGIAPDIVLTLIGGAVFVWLFGKLSRRFERQADVFAARTVRAHEATDVVPVPADSSVIQPVDSHGAVLFSSALHRVAVINNIPITAPSWCHGSILSRMNFLRELAHDPAQTRAFDQHMTRLYGMLLLALLASAGLLVLVSR